ncbi:hypothetical protein DY000_02015241 [Brassica cretica]|uniref:Uncharacterized protein n=1 Tax=Brassica cretica TaxID=69181 RepID=A0ABQ7D2B8_BRACR|nr:hypothetical protein DY000_02015241 [Brassica cretica]
MVDLSFLIWDPELGFFLKSAPPGAVTRFVRQEKWVWSVFRVARIGAEVFRSVSPLLIELIVALAPSFKMDCRGPLQGMHRFQSSEGVRWYWPVRKLLHPLVTFSHGSIDGDPCSGFTLP